MRFRLFERLFGLTVLLLIPAATLLSLIVQFPALATTSRVEELLIWTGLVYCQLVFLARTDFWEVPIYVAIIYLLASYLFVRLNTAINDVDYSVVGFWLEGPFLCFLWLPIKAGYHKNIEEIPLRDEERGLFSRNPLISFFQHQLGVVSIKPLGVLLVLYNVLLVVGFFLGRYICWQRLLSFS